MENTQREAGYYWTILDGRTTVSHWNGDKWLVYHVFTEMKLDDGHFEKIYETRILSPNEEIKDLCGMAYLSLSKNQSQIPMDKNQFKKLTGLE